MSVNLELDRGDRRTLRIPVTRNTEDPAGSVQVAVATDWQDADWVTLNPVDPDVNPAYYEVLVAYGEATDFSGVHPGGTKVVTGPTAVWVRSSFGTNVDVQQVAWVTPR